MCPGQFVCLDWFMVGRGFGGDFFESYDVQSSIVSYLIHSLCSGDVK